MMWERAKCMLRNGAKITRPNWDQEHFWKLSNDGYERIICHDGSAARIHLKQTEAEDWELWKEKVSVGEIQQSMRRFIESKFEGPDTIQISENIASEFGNPNQLLGMDVVVCPTIGDNEFYLSRDREILQIRPGQFYRTKDNKFLYVHEITFFNSLLFANNHIAAIVTGNKTDFRGDAKTNVLRRIFNENDFREEVKNIC